MKLTGSQLKELLQALLDAYPTPSALEQMVRVQLDENLHVIASGDDLSERIFNLITWAETNGRLVDLVDGAHADNPGNPELGAWVRGPWQALLREAPQHPPAPTSDPNTQPAPPPGWVVWWRQLKPELKVSILVALIAAVGSILAALLPVLLTTTPPTPTAVAVAATATSTATSTPTAAPTQTPAATPTPAVGATASPILIPTVVRTPLRVGIAAFANCGDEGFSGNLQETILQELRAQKFNTQKIQFTSFSPINSELSARRVTDHEVVLWGECSTDNAMNYRIELLLVGDGLDHRIAQLESLRLTWPGAASQGLFTTLAGILAYYSSAGDDTTEVAAVLLHNSSPFWGHKVLADSNRYLHFILGNAWLHHPDKLYDDALDEYLTVLNQLPTHQNDIVALEAAVYNNQGWVYYAQRRYEDAIQAFSKAIEQKRDYIWAYIGRSAAYVRTSKEEMAELADTDCESAIKLRANYAPAYICRIWAIYYSDISDGQLANPQLSLFLDKAIQADKSYPTSYWYAGANACLAEHNRQRAIEQFQAFLLRAFVTPIWDKDYYATIALAKVWLEDDLSQASSCK